MSLGPDQTGQVEIDDLGSFMPWALQIDSSLRIQWVGPSLQKHGLALAVGDHTDQHLELKRPAMPIFQWDDLVSLVGKLVTWRCSGMEFDLRGAIHLQACGNAILLIGNPILRKAGDFGLFGITLSDFARHDATPDLLLALQARDVSILEAAEAAENQAVGALLRQSILDSAMDAMITIDMEGLVIEFNQAAVKMFGFARDDVLGKSISELIVPQEMREDHVFSLLRCLEPGEAAGLGQRIQSPAIRADGTIIPIETAIVPFKYQGERYFTASIRDLSKQKEAAAELAQSALFRQSILDSAMDAMITIDLEGRVVEFNDAAVGMFGYCREDALGKSVSELVIPPELRKAHAEGLHHYRTTGNARVLGQRLQLPAQRADGTEFPIEMAIVAFKYNESEYFTASIRDMTAEKKAQATIAQDAEQKRLLQRELDHRVTNMLAHLVMLCRRASHKDSQDSPAITSLKIRIESMSKIHDLLGSESQSGLGIGQLIKMCIDPYVTSSEGAIMEGPSLRLTDKASFTLAMVFNELAVNASKYGALHYEGGIVKIEWKIQGGDEGTSALLISWEEMHDGAVPQLLHGGLGTEIIRAAIGYELGGNVELKTTPRGILFLATIPVSQALLDNK